MEGLAERAQKGLKLCASMPLVFFVCRGTMAAHSVRGSLGVLGNAAFGPSISY